jgi:flagellar protein FlaG
MNEITNTTSVPVQPKPVTGSAVVAGIRSQQSGKPLPVDPQAAKSQQADVKELQANVEAAVAQMNEYIQSTQRDLHFSYDKASGETVVKVLDRSTQEVIRQIPDEIFLKLAQNKDFEGAGQLFSAQA